jgi:hypothetical protein
MSRVAYIQFLVSPDTPHVLFVLRRAFPPGGDVQGGGLQRGVLNVQHDSVLAPHGEKW